MTEDNLAPDLPEPTNEAVPPTEDRDVAEVAAALRHDRYTRSNAYDPLWALDHRMGPNALWLAESLLEVQSFPTDARVLDLGCGTALSSIFLAKECGAQVWAADLWIEPTLNYRRVVEAGLDQRVLPCHAEAHDLPWPDGFFDAVVSFDAYHYFGTAQQYLAYICRFIRPGGTISIVVPGLRTELGGTVPEHLERFWQPEFWTFHSPQWWADLWQTSGEVDVEHADLVEDGWVDWMRWNELSVKYGKPKDIDPTGAATLEEADMLRGDGGRYLGFSRVVATRR